MHVEDSSDADSPAGSPSDDEDGSPVKTKKKKTKHTRGSDARVTIKGCPVPRPQLAALYEQYAGQSSQQLTETELFDQLTDELLEYDATPALVAKWLTKAGLLVTPGAAGGDATGGKKRSKSSQHHTPGGGRGLSQQHLTQGRPAAAAAAAAAAGGVHGNVVHVPEPRPLQVLGYLAALHQEHQESGE
jgi:hypothetical protein